MSAISLSFDMSNLTDLVPKLHGIHAYQLLHILLYNQAQRANVAILQFARTLGYTPIHTDVQLTRLIGTVRAVSVLMNITNGAPPFASNNLLTIQLLDGFSRTIHLLPDHIRTDVSTNLNYFQACIKGKMIVTPMAILINMAPILQEQPNFDSELLDVTSVDNIPAMLSNDQTLPDLRRISDNVTQQSDTDPREVAFAAQLRDRQRLSAPDRFRPSPDTYAARQDNARRDVRIDPRQAICVPSTRNVRQDTYGASSQPRKADPSSQTATLEDLQRTIASLQSQIDRQARQARKEDTSNSNRFSSASAHLASSKPTSVPDDPDVIDQEYAPPPKFYALGASVEYCSDDLPCPAGTSFLRRHIDSDDGVSGITSATVRDLRVSGATSSPPHSNGT